MELFQPRERIAKSISLNHYITRPHIEDKLGTLLVVIGNTTRLKVLYMYLKVTTGYAKSQKFTFSVCEMGMMIGCAQFSFLLVKGFG